MKNVLMLVLAFAIVWVVWHVVASFVFGIAHLAILVGMIALFAWLVSTVYRALINRQ